MQLVPDLRGPEFEVCRGNEFEGDTGVGEPVYPGGWSTKWKKVSWKKEKKKYPHISEGKQGYFKDIIYQEYRVSPFVKCGVYLLCLRTLLSGE